MCIYSIYKITNILNNKVYIGQTKSPEYRIKDHFSGRGSSILWNSIQKYGIDSFNQEILYQSKDQSHIDDVEKLFISEHRSTDRRFGYNIQNGGKSGGNIQSDETKLKLSNKLKGRPKPPRTSDHLRKIGEGNLGKSKPNSGPKGRCYYHNELSEILVKKDSPIPDGFRKGRIPGKYGNKFMNIKRQSCQDVPQ